VFFISYSGTYLLLFQISVLCKLISFNYLTQNEEKTGETCSTHGIDGKCTLSLIGKLEGRDHLEDLSLDAVIILKQIRNWKVWSGWLAHGSVRVL
jgi:hypothetical protein